MPKVQTRSITHRRQEDGSNSRDRKRLLALSRRKAIEAREMFETIIPSHRSNRVTYIEKQAALEFGSRPSTKNALRCPRGQH